MLFDQYYFDLKRTKCFEYSSTFVDTPKDTTQRRIGMFCMTCNIVDICQLYSTLWSSSSFILLVKKYTIDNKTTETERFRTAHKRHPTAIVMYCKILWTIVFMFGCSLWWQNEQLAEQLYIYAVQGHSMSPIWVPVESSYIRLPISD